MAGLPKIYKRYQGQYTRSITAVALAVILAAVCYFTFAMLAKYVPTAKGVFMPVRNTSASWAFDKDWPSKESPQYKRGEVVTDQAREQLDQAGVDRWYFMAANPVQYALWIRYGVPALLFAVGGFFVFNLVNSERFADFLIQTEGEMKKVSWSSKAELIGSTAVVIVTVIIMALLIYVADFIWIAGLKLITVLPGK